MFWSGKVHNKVEMDGSEYRNSTSTAAKHSNENQGPLQLALGHDA
jgi:hypothetical protein